VFQTCGKTENVYSPDLLGRINPIHLILTLDNSGAALFPEAALKSKFTRPCIAKMTRENKMHDETNIPDFEFLELLR
jgi:hypothetical protein